MAARHAVTLQFLSLSSAQRPATAQRSFFSSAASSAQRPASSRIIAIEEGEVRGCAKRAVEQKQQHQQQQHEQKQQQA